jgi:UDP-2-acetamido-2,6-beta-L-arabino-hexul-4-ose reductase
MDDIDSVIQFVNSCDRIYHLAGKNRAEKGQILKNNIISTSNLVFASLLKETPPEIIFSSSHQVLWSNLSEYVFAKTIEEEIIRRSKKWCIFRIPNVYGPGCRPFYNSVVATFCHQIARGQPVTINDPKVKRKFIFIDDLVSDLLSPKFNTEKSPSGEIMTIGDLHSLLTDRLGEHKKLETSLQYYLGQVD